MQIGGVMDDWNDLRLVLALARGGALSDGARRLGVDPTTASRRLRALERTLGVRVFGRADGRLMPTEAGERMLARAERVEAEVLGLDEEIGGGLARCEGMVRVTAVPVLVNRLILPRLHELLAAHPGLEIEAIAAGENLSFGRREADLALRLARPLIEAALCRRVGTLSYSVYAPAQRDPVDLPWITYDEAHAHLPQARWVAVQGGSAAVRVKDAEGLLAAVRAGLGKALLPDLAAADDPLLRRACEAEAVLVREIWLLIHPEVQPLRRVRVVTGWLADLCRRLGRP
jgi:DNA-binding transcriptional LysR family regulator